MGMHQHECDRGAELDDLRKQVDDLSKSAVAITGMQVSNTYVKETVDKLVVKVDTLTDVVQKMAISQATSQELIRQLATTKQEVAQDIAECGAQCAEHRRAASSRIGGLETIVRGTADKPGIVGRVQDLETVARVTKWVGVVVCGAIITYSIYVGIMVVAHR